MHLPSFTFTRRAAFVSAGAVVILGAVATLQQSLEQRRAATGDSRRVAASAVADTQRVVLHVTGMICESCESTVTVMLRRTPGVMNAVVSVERAEAVIVFDPAKTSPAKLIDVVKSLGYTASVEGA